MRDDLLRQIRGGCPNRSQMKFRRGRWLIDIIHSREAANLPGIGLFIKTFRITFGADSNRSIDEDLDKLPRLHQIPCHATLQAIGRNQTYKNDQTRVEHELCDMRGPSDIFDAIRDREPKILIKSVPQIVAIKDEGVFTGCVQQDIDMVGDRSLSRTGQSGKPQDPRSLRLLDRARFSI